MQKFNDFWNTVMVEKLSDAYEEIERDSSENSSSSVARFTLETVKVAFANYHAWLLQNYLDQ